MDYKPFYVWPNPAFPFRVYYEGKNCRIFIIENLDHNFEWLKKYHHKIRDGDRFLVLVGCHYTDALAKGSAKMFELLGLKKEQFYILFNDQRDENVFSTYGFVGSVINQNAWIDETIMEPRSAKKLYDAIYVARMIAVKRHYLAAQVPNLALVAGLLHGNTSQAVIPSHVYRNDAPLTPDEVCQKMNESRCGLILSHAEGASFVSSEYLLSGIPIVSTQSEGGRAVWYDDYNSRVVEDSPGAVRDAVQFFNENPRDPMKIRNGHIQKAKQYREKFVTVIQDIVDEFGEGVDMQEHFNQNYFHKMRKSYTPNFDAIFG